MRSHLPCGRRPRRVEASGVYHITLCIRSGRSSASARTHGVYRRVSLTADTCCVPFSAVEAMCCVAQALVGLPLGTDLCTSNGPMHTQARRCLPARAARILQKRCRAVADGPRMQRRPLSIKLGAKAAKPSGWPRPLARMQVWGQDPRLATTGRSRQRLSRVGM